MRETGRAAWTGGVRWGQVREDGALADADLARAAQAGEPGAEEALLARYRFIAQRVARRFRLPGAEEADVYQIASLGVLRAIRGFDAAHGSEFEPFAWSCALRAVHQARRQERLVGRRALNEALSLDTEAGRKYLAGLEAAPLRPRDEREVPLPLRRARHLLSRQEWEVAVAWCMGHSTRATARALGVSPATLFRIRRQVRAKLRAHPEFFE